MAYIYLLMTILFTSYGQLIIKWRLPMHGTMPAGFFQKVLFILSLYFDPFIMSGFIGAFVASMFWVATLSKLPLNHAYPFMALSFVIVLLASALLLQETLTWPKIIGVVLIIAGIAVGSQG